MDYQAQIDDILDNFRFARVHKMMKAVGWAWGDGVPGEPELRRTARRMLHNLVDDGHACIETGGFIATKEDGAMRLIWGEEWTADVEDEEEDG